MAEGLSRRDMIKGAAVAGAAAWTAPMIIDSVMSPAAAASGNCTGSSVTMSWIYVLFQKPGSSTIYLTGYSGGGTTCGGGGKNNGGTRCNINGVSAPCGKCWPACTNPTGYTITLNNFSTNPPTPGAGDVTYGTGGACGANDDWVWMGTPTCTTYLQFNNGKIQALGGAKILAAMGFGGGSLIPACVNSNTTNNEVCGIE